ncbi:MAG: DUF4395 domain-containing protein [Chloroflexi bacterium]|nr:DUF4395 domain-containing protein [Chloroflexota bacterium]
MITVRTIDPRGQRFGAAFSAVTLLLGFAIDQPLLAAVVGIALAVSAALGTQWFLFGRPWPTIRRNLHLGAPPAVEPELGPRFAQALGAAFVAIGFVLYFGGIEPWFWTPILAVAGLQTLLAVTGFCLGCRLYGLHWFLPAVFDRIVLRAGTVPGTRLRNPRLG